MSTTLLLRRTSQAISLCLILTLLSVTNAAASCIFSKPMKIKELDVGNMLSWSTFQEVGNEYFEVQKSLDGVAFNAVGKVRGAMDSNEESNYRFLDITTGEKRVYYRLKQIDIDGNTAHTQTIVATRDNENNFVVTAMSSWMTDRFFTVTVRSSIEDILDYSIVDKGQVILKNGMAEVVDGANLITIDLKGLENGDYQFVLQMKDEREMVQLKKVNKDDVPVVNYVIKE